MIRSYYELSDLEQLYKPLESVCLINPDDDDSNLATRKSVVTERNLRPRIETILHTALKIQVDRACSREEKRAQNVGGKWKEGRKKKHSR